MMRGGLIRGLALALSVVIMAACGGSSSSSGDDSLNRAKTNGLRIAFFDVVPWSFVDNQSNFVGVDPDLAQMCGKQLGVTHFYPTLQGFDALIPGLLAHRFDLITAGMFTTKQRADVVAPSQGLYQLGDVALVAKGNPLGIHSWSDLAAKHAIVGVNPGSVEGQLGQKYGFQTKTYETLDSMVADLKIGRIQSVVGPGPGFEPYLKAVEGTNLEIATPWDYQGNFGTPALWFNKADNALRTAFDGCISEMKQNGAYAQILVKYGLSASDEWPAGKSGLGV